MLYFVIIFDGASLLRMSRHSARMLSACLLARQGRKSKQDAESITNKIILNEARFI